LPFILEVFPLVSLLLLPNSSLLLFKLSKQQKMTMLKSFYHFWSGGTHPFFYPLTTFLYPFPLPCTRLNYTLVYILWNLHFFVL
jgi:hypothetical protein